MYPIEETRKHLAAPLRTVCWVKPILKCVCVTSCFPGSNSGENGDLSTRKLSEAPTQVAKFSDQARVNKAAIFRKCSGMGTK
jgi:hypothetical protein